MCPDLASHEIEKVHIVQGGEEEWEGKEEGKGEREIELFS